MFHIFAETNKKHESHDKEVLQGIGRVKEICRRRAESGAWGDKTRELLHRPRSEHCAMGRQLADKASVRKIRDKEQSNVPPGVLIEERLSV